MVILQTSSGRVGHKDHRTSVYQISMFGIRDIRNGPLGRRKWSYNSSYFYTFNKKTNMLSQPNVITSKVHCKLTCTRHELAYGNSLAVCKTSLTFQITTASLLSRIGYTFMSHFWLGMTPGHKVMKHPVFVPTQANTTVRIRTLKSDQKVKE